MAKNFTAAENRREGYTHVLLITTGSVASIKAPLIVEELLKVRDQGCKNIYIHLFLIPTQYKSVSVQVAATKPSLTFFKPGDIRSLGVDVWTDDDEWNVRTPSFHYLSCPAHPF